MLKIATPLRNALRTTQLRTTTINYRFQSTQTTPNQQPSPQSSQSSSSGNSRFNKALTATALVVAGTFLGMTWASFNICKNPPEFLFPHTSTFPLDKANPPIYGDYHDVIKEISDHFKPDQISFSKDEKERHSDSYFSTDHPLPTEFADIIIYPETTAQVSLILKAAHKYHVPIVPFTGGTSLEGHYIPTRNGISIDMSRMNKIIQLNEDDLDITVQAGVGWEDLNDFLQPKGFLFGPDPGPGACIGGMCGTSCSGTNAARYGTMRENTIALTVVLADGTIIKTKRRPRKSAAGYNLTQLFVGSEGTLGIVCEATLKLHVRPKFENVAVVCFPTLHDAANAVAMVVQSGIPVNAMELLDDEMMKYVNLSGGVTNKYKELPTLMFKIGANSNKVVDALTNDLKEICYASNCGKKDFRFASSDEEKEELWTARKVALWSTLDIGKQEYGDDVQLWTTDVAVPISKQVDSLIHTRQLFTDNGLRATIVAHAGDGNYHTFILYKKEDYKKVSAVVGEMVKHALTLDGTVTGEHGVGIGKREYLLEELGEKPVDLMRKIKFALDPLLILNPDKIFKIDPNDEKST